MRIDSSGNLLVGKTSTAFGTAGAALYASGDNDFVNDGNVMSLNRLSSDGSIVTFYKNSSAVGSIGTEGGDLVLGTGTNCGIQFNDGNNAIRPFNMASNAPIDNVVDLGISGTRFKDLYLSGGAYLGGTGAANKLDDYEEGTWTPTIEGAGTGGSYTLSNLTAQYTKVGNLVTLKAQFGFSAASGGTSYARVHGLPFSYAAGAGVFGTFRADNYNFQAADPVTVILAATTSGSGSTLNFLEIQDNTGPIDAPVTGI